MNGDIFFRKLHKKLFKLFHGNFIDHWNSVRGKYAGRAGFVIGNGPSLRYEDLGRINNVISIASNKIYLAYPHTSWRPSFVTVIDNLVWADIKGTLQEHFDEVIVPWSMDLRGCNCKLKAYRYQGVVSGYCDKKEAPKFSNDLTKGIFGGHSVTYDNLQLAVHLGLNPIYLIGCDHYYSGEKSDHNGNPVASSTAQNHFVKNYRKPGEVINAAPIEKMNWAYQHAAEYARRSGVRIYNATRGGHLEAFPRADLDQVLDELDRQNAD